MIGFSNEQSNVLLIVNVTNDIQIELITEEIYKDIMNKVCETCDYTSNGPVQASECPECGSYMGYPL